jgi:hypothetical protein
MPQKAAVRRVFGMEDHTGDGGVGTQSAATGEASPLAIRRFGMGMGLAQPGAWIETCPSTP